MRDLRSMTGRLPVALLLLGCMPALAAESGAEFAPGRVLAQAPASSPSTTSASAARPGPAAPSSIVPAAAPPASPAPALPFTMSQSAIGFTGENLRFAIGPISYRVPRIEVRGTNLSKDELSRLLDPASTVPLRERVARLSASEIVVPEVISEIDGPTGRQVATYRDVRLIDIAAGRIARATTANGSFESASPQGPARGGFARMEIAEIDAALAVSLFEGKEPSAPPELRTVYRSVSLDGLTTVGPTGATARVARMAGRDFSARPTADGWIGTANRLSGQIDLNKASPEERGRAVTAMLDLLEAFEVGTLEATGIEFQDPKEKDASGRIARIAYTGGSTAEFRIDGFEAGGGGGRFRVASISLGGLSFGPMLRAARDLATAKPDELTAADMRRLIPIVGAFRVSGVDAETGPDRKKPEERPVRVAIGSMEFLAEKPVEGIPTEIRMNLRNVSVPVDPASKDDSMKQIAELGYGKVDASMTANLGWNEAGQELVLRELSAQVADMGSFVVRGVLGNVSKDVFSPDAALASVALIGATAKSLDIAVENSGLFERMLTRETRRQKRSADDLRREYGMAAAVGIPVMLGNSPAAKTIGQAVARFVTKPGRLLIQARTKEPGGLGVADFAGNPDPEALLAKLEVTATAQ